MKYPLPAEPKPHEKSFQTKDFARQLNHYTITDDGRLLRDGAAISYHGVFSFYTYTSDEMWFEYEAKFTDGRLIAIQPLSICRNGDDGTRHVLYPDSRQ